MAISVELTLFNAQLTPAATVPSGELTHDETAGERLPYSMPEHSIDNEGGSPMKCRNLIAVVGLIAISGAASALAVDQAKYQAIKSGAMACAWCDLSGADLSNFKLSGADLSGANLTEADLRGADLRNVDFSGADLTGAVVDGADLSGANLVGADIDRVDLSKAALKGARLERANCDWATIFPESSGLACVGVTVERK